MARKKTGKNVPQTMTAFEAMGNAVSELEGLKEEMDEWASNMESSNLESTDKCQRVRESADMLEESHCECDGKSDEIEELVGKLEGFKVPSVTYHEYVPYKGRSISRADRLGNASAAMEAALEALSGALEDIKVPEGNEGPQESLQEAKDMVEETKTGWESAQDVEFPGMYG